MNTAGTAWAEHADRNSINRKRKARISPPSIGSGNAHLDPAMRPVIMGKAQPVSAQRFRRALVLNVIPGVDKFLFVGGKLQMKPRLDFHFARQIQMHVRRFHIPSFMDMPGNQNVTTLDIGIPAIGANNALCDRPAAA